MTATTLADSFDQAIGLVRAAGELRRQATWARAARRRAILGASDVGQTDLTAVIRVKVASGRLPRECPPKMWVGPGSGKACDGCDLPITHDQREYEFDPTGWPTIRLHLECVEIWHLKRATLGSGAIRGGGDGVDTAAARMAAVIRDGFPSGYCVECLAARLDVLLREARDAALLLAARPGFQVVHRICYPRWVSTA